MSHLMFFGFEFAIPSLIIGFWIAVAWMVVRWMKQVLFLKRENNDLLRKIIERLDKNIIKHQ